jgi:enamine deaminase RidA (YjgF/YER057c/UK114 family)
MRMRFLNVFLLVAHLNFVTSLFSEELFYSLFEGSKETAAVTVKRSGLVHTKLLTTPGNPEIAPAFSALIQQLTDIATSFETSTAAVAKLNLYLNTDKQSELDAVQALVHSHWGKGKAPALTLIPSKLPDGGLLAGDAVIAASEPRSEIPTPNPTAAMTDPRRDIIYVSGRAASGELAPATAQTMEQIFDVLKHLKSAPQDIVQVKAFIQPVDQWKLVEAEIVKSFGGNSPPIVYVEWTSGSRATEIEVIASSPIHQESKESASYFTPPGENASPVFSRVSIVHADKVIYFSGHRGGGSEADSEAIYAQLKRTAKASGTDLRHFAKATYYVTTPEASASLNAVRPGHYDPARPPAASKVMIRSLGAGDTQVLIDMVAAPVGK